MANHPVSRFRFRVDWGGTRLGFAEVSGLDLGIEVIAHRDGGGREHAKRRMPGMHTHGSITMKRGVFASDKEYLAWFNGVTGSRIEPRDVTVSLLNEDEEPVVVWRVKHAWPVKIVASDLKADGNEVAIETIEVAHEGLEIQNDQGGA